MIFEDYGFVKKVEDPKLKFVMTEAGCNQAKVEELIESLSIT